MKSATLRGGFAAIALIAVAACSATGGQNASTIPGAGLSPAASQGVAPDRRRHHKPKPTKLKQRVLAGAALSVVGSSLELDQFGSQNGLLMQLLGFGHDVSHKRGRSSRSSGGSCQNGVESTWSSSGQGQVSQTIEFFYDAACTEPFNLVTLNADFTPLGGTAQGTQETWNQTGAVVSYQTFTATFTVGLDGGIGEIVIQKSSGPAPSSPPTQQSGYTCLFNNGDALDCGSGTVTSLAAASPTPEDVGFEQTVVGQFVTPSPGPSSYPSGEPSAYPSGYPSAYPSASPSPSPTPTGGPKPDWHHGGGGYGHGGCQSGPSGLELTINGAGYSGALGTLTLAAGTPPAWTIGGGTQDNTLTGTAIIGFGGYEHGHGGWHQHQGGWHGNWGHHGGDPGSGVMTSVNLTLNDTQDGLTVVLTSGGGGNLNGAVTQTSTGQSVATMTVNFSGTGTITYSNGSIDQVQNWIIVN